ncbi:MAG: hypothetical protein OXH76_22430 [Boseongicola sp.]|nr:hypothetical protein [Boseongicola sp.]
MKSTKAMAAATLAAAILAGGASAAEPQLPKTVAEAKAQLKAGGGPQEHPVPPGNVRNGALNELLAGSVTVSRHPDLESLLPRRSLKIVWTGRDERVETCSQLLPVAPPMALRWSWSTGKVRIGDGVVQPVVLMLGRTPMIRNDAGVFSVLHDGETGEIAWHDWKRSLFGDWRQEYIGHLQERLPAATWTLCPDFPSAEELGADVNRAQTAIAYDALVAQDPGRRIRRPDLLAKGVEEDGSLEGWIGEILDIWREADGRALMVATGEEVPSGGAFVYYEPLSALWMFDVRDPDEAAGAPLSEAGTATWVVDADGEDARLRFRRTGLDERARGRYGRDSLDTRELAWPRLFPQHVAAKERHPLSVMHDRILAGRLAHDFQGIPAGSRFDADGAVRFHGEGRTWTSDDDSGVEVFSAVQASGATWKSHGDFIRIGRGFGVQAVTVPVGDLAAAMEAE